MGYRASNRRDADERAAWRALPLRYRYNWLMVVIVALSFVLVVTLIVRGG